MKRATITTESTGPKYDESLRIASDTFAGYSIRGGEGVWEGDVEDSHDIIIVNLDELEDFERRVRAVARTIKRANQQEAVLVVFDEVDAELI